MRASPLPLILLVLLPATARANLVGPLFSGPTAADPMVVYWNPGAMTLLSGTSGMAFGGVTTIAIDYDRSTPSGLDGSRFATAELRVPRPEIGVGVVTDATLRRFRFGVTFAIPILDGATWDERYGGKPSSTRYFALTGQQIHALVRPAVAYQVTPWLSVGAGFDIYPLILRQDLMIDFGAKVNQLACKVNRTACQIDAPLRRENPAYDGRSTIDGSGVAFGASGGILLTPWRWLRVGASIHSGGGTISVPAEIEVEIPPAVRDFVAQSLPGVALPELKAAGEVRSGVCPLAIIAGASVLPGDRLELEAMFMWMQKSKLSSLWGDIKATTSSLITDQVLIRAFDDDWRFGLRGSYQLLPTLRLGARAEYLMAVRPERHVSPISIDLHKVQLEFGAAWQATRWLTVYAEYAHFFLVPRTIAQSVFAPNADPVTPEEQGLDRPYPLGTYTGTADRFAVGLLFSF